MPGAGVLVGRGYVSIRPEFEGDWSRQASSQGESAGRAGGSSFSKSFGKVASAGLKTIGSLGLVGIAGSLASAAVAGAGLAPALATAGTAAGALSIGLSGVGAAFKAAFSDSTADAAAAASATRAVQSAQESLAKAQRSVADARVQAAEQVKSAEDGVTSAERDLSDAQKDALDAQKDLNGARVDATRALQDMNDQLAGSQLDEKQAVFDLTDAQKELSAARANPGTTPEDLAKLQLAYDKASLNLKEQRTDTQRLTVDTAAANKAGVEGSTQVLAAKQKISDADQEVSDREKALADAQAGVAKAQADGQRQIADAQQGVADAAAALAQAQAAAAAQTSALDQAMAKLAPNARDFVNSIRALIPAWTGLKLSVQNALFQGLGASVTSLAQVALPILKKRLTETAGIWNTIGQNAITAFHNMASSGILDKILVGSNKNLALFEKAPAQIVTAFGQLAVAAQPALNGLLTQFAGAITAFTDGLTKSFTSGGLQQAISTAFNLLEQFGTTLGNALGVVMEILDAASSSGTAIVGILGSVLGQLKKTLAGPEVQAALNQLFTGVGQIITSLLPVVGQLVASIIPLLAALAKPLGAIASVLGPVLTQLAKVLGDALLPLFTAFGKIVQTVGLAAVKVLQELTPLVGPLVGLFTALLQAVQPIIKVLTDLAVKLVGALVGPLQQVMAALKPVISTIGSAISGVFTALTPLIGPIVDLIGTAASLLAGVFSTAVTTALNAIKPLIPVGVKLVNSIIKALVPLLPPVKQALTAIAGAFLQLMKPMGDVVSQLAVQLAPVLIQLAPLLGQLVTVFTGALAQVLPQLVNAFTQLVTALAPLMPLFDQLVFMLITLGAQALVQLMPSLIQLVQAIVNFSIAITPLIPSMVQIIALFLQLAFKVIIPLLPQITQLANLFVKFLVPALTFVLDGLTKTVNFINQYVVPAVNWLHDTISKGVADILRIFQNFYDVLIGHSILPDIVNYIRNVFALAFTWFRDKIVKPVWTAIQNAISFAWNKVIKPVWNAIISFLRGTFTNAWNAIKNTADKVWNGIKTTISTVWTKGIKPAFDAVKSAVGKVADAFGTAKTAIGKAWNQIEALAKKPIAYVVNTVYDKGVVPVWNAVAKAFGAPALKTMKFATGGPVNGAGTATSDSVPAWLSSGEHVWTAKEVQGAGGHGAVASMRQWAAAGGGPDAPGFKDGGGLFGWIGKGASALAGAGSKAWSGVKKVAGWLKDGLETSARAGVKKVVNPLLKHIPGAGTPFGKMIAGIPTQIIDALTGYAKKADGKMPTSIGGKIPTGQHKSIITQALAAAHVPPPGTMAQWLTGMNTLITRESGWNAGAINLTDSNAKAGHPSQGLTQTIPGTFNAYVPPALKFKGINDPVANVAASIRYIKSRYGNITNVQQANASLPPKGYDNGGLLMPGWTPVYNGLGKPEAVFTPSQLKNLTSPAAGSDQPVRVEIHTRDQALADFVDVRVYDANERLIQNLTAGGGR